MKDRDREEDRERGDRERGDRDRENGANGEDRKGTSTTSPPTKEFNYLTLR